MNDPYLTAQDIIDQVGQAGGVISGAPSTFDGATLYYMLTFPNMTAAANYVSTSAIEAHCIIFSRNFRFDEEVRVRFAYSDYEREADQINGYDPESADDRQLQYAHAQYKRIMAARKERASLTAADGFYPVAVGERFWDNNLDLVEVTEVKRFSETNQNNGQVSWWHRVKLIERYDGTPGDGRLSDADNSRLAKRHPSTGREAK